VAANDCLLTKTGELYLNQAKIAINNLIMMWLTTYNDVLTAFFWRGAMLM